MDYKQLYKRKGKVEREEEHHEKNWRREKRYEPRDDIEKCIAECQQMYNNKRGKIEGNIEPKVACDLYLQARSLRHDLWVAYLNRTRLRAESSFGDVKVETFCMDAGISKRDIPPEIGRLTPDILTWSPKEDYIILGDVTVTNVVEQSRRDKMAKYGPVMDFLKTHNYDVRWGNLVISHDLSNLRQQINELQTIDLIANDKNRLERTMHFHAVIDELYKTVGLNTSNAQEFWRLVNESDKVEPRPDDLPEPEFSRLFEMDIQNPELSEEMLLQELVSMTFQKEEEGYFDCDIQKVSDSITKIIEQKREVGKWSEPKSVIKGVFNTRDVETTSSYNLIRNFIKDIHMTNDSPLKTLFLDVLPTLTQVDIMEEMYNKRGDESINTDDFKTKMKEIRVHGPNQYDMSRQSQNQITINLFANLKKGKKQRNVKKEPPNLNPEFFTDHVQDMNLLINYLGSDSNKQPFLDDTWDAATNYEVNNSREMRETYDSVRRSNGAQLCHAFSEMHHKIMHTKTSLAVKDSVFVPPNGSFIMIKPKEHAPITSKRCDLPFLFITREPNNNDDISIQYFNEHEYSFSSSGYTYYMSKLSRLNLDKISHWDQAGYKLVSAASHILNTCEILRTEKERTIGLLTLLLLDSHQKVSEYLDLLKYISFMPFSDINRLDKLVEDKLDLLMKTKMDVWLLLRIDTFMKELARIDRLKASKPKLHLYNSQATRESLGLHMELPSFINPTVRHKSVEQFIEEITMLYIIRPKQLYGSQFMEKSLIDTVSWNIEYESEQKEHGTWVTNGHNVGAFPFDSKFAFNKSAIIHAYKYLRKKVPIDTNKVSRKLHSSVYKSYMHYNCTLRGCTKYKADRQNNNDLHTTSLEACLKHYKAKSYSEHDCTVVGVVQDFIDRNEPMQFSMSEKEQRGGGRPIATPTLGAKASLMMIEKPEQAIGSLVPNNIIVPGKNKLKEQADTYKRLISAGATDGYKQVYQLTEDQSKYSENDNIRKYYPYIANNELLPYHVRKLQYYLLTKLEKREHLSKKIPDKINNDPEYAKYRNDDLNGIKAQIGWPQGMLNDLSTSIHSMADYWITYMFNKAYPNDPVKTEGLVHSDDSWVAVACNSISTFKRFAIFRMLAKRYFCLKLNEKKLWGSKYLGELVSNYNINGNVHLSISKILANSMNNLLYQNWTLDVSNQVSSLQQLYRNGAKIPTLIMLGTILRQQIIGSYQVKGKQLEYLNMLPIELGGYPSSSAFELGVTGLTSHYSKIYEYVKTNPESPISKIILRCLFLSNDYNKQKRKGENDPGARALKHATTQAQNIIDKHKADPRMEQLDIDYASTPIPSRSEVFSCARHLLPKSRKLNMTLARINELPFESDGLELIVPRPNKLSTALGHLKHQLTTRLFELASEHYTQNARRLAVSQALQSSQKVVRLFNLVPMTFNEFLSFMETTQLACAEVDSLEVSLTDDTDISNISRSVVYMSELTASDKDKRKIINRMPNVIDKFSTVCNIRNVLLHIIDETSSSTRARTNYLSEYGTNVEHVDLLTVDAELIKRRFNIFFRYFETDMACNSIMRLYMFREKARLWMQPYLKTDTMTNFLKSLYGKTLNEKVNFKVEFKERATLVNSEDIHIIDTLYSVNVLNCLYPGKFIMLSFRDKPIPTVLNDIDYATLMDQDYLKYAVLQKHHNGEEKYLDNYDKKKMYDQQWIVKQRYNEKRKRYEGSFNLLCRYGKTIVQIEGEPEEVSITASTVDTEEILRAMQHVVTKNFPYYKYQHYAQWSNSAFWNNKKSLSKMYLTNYSRVTTLIVKTKGVYSIPFTLNPLLMGPMNYGDSERVEYEITENMRVITKVTRDGKVRLDNIVQNLNCPYSNEVELVPAVLDGLHNKDLLDDNILINVTSSKYHSCSKAKIMDALNGRLPAISNEVLVDFYVNLINSLDSQFQHIQPRYVPDIDENVETITIAGTSASATIAAHAETEPEDLTCLQLDYQVDTVERQGALSKHESLTRLLCNVAMPKLPPGKLELLLNMLVHDPSIASGLVRDLRRPQKMYDDEIDNAIADELETSVREWDDMLEDKTMPAKAKTWYELVEEEEEQVDDDDLSESSSDISESVAEEETVMAEQLSQLVEEDEKKIPLVDRIQSLRNIVDIMPHDPSVNMFIYSNNLDKEETWSRIDRLKIKQPILRYTDYQLVELARKLARAVRISVHEKTKQSAVEVLMDMLENSSNDGSDDNV